MSPARHAGRKGALTDDDDAQIQFHRRPADDDPHGDARRAPGRDRGARRRREGRPRLPRLRPAHQLLRLLVQRQDRTCLGAREAGLRAGGPWPLRDGPRAHHPGGAADAAPVRDPIRSAECVCHWPQPEARRSGGHERDHEAAVGGRAAGRDLARARARAQPRHPHPVRRCRPTCAARSPTGTRCTTTRRNSGAATRSARRR